MKITKLILSVAFCTALFSLSVAQKGRGGETGKLIEDFNLKKDFSVGGKSVIKKSKAAGIVKGALHFKNITSDLRYVGKGQERTTAKAWAILEGISEQTMQAISDEFAASFSKKIEGLGIGMKDWNTIKSSKIFPKIDSKQIKKVKSNQATGLVLIKTANDGPHTKQVVGNPGIWGSYAKIGKDIGGNAITYDINVDFARFDIDAKRWKSSGYGPGYDFVTTSAEANVLPQISIEAANGATGLGNMATNLTFVGKYGEAGIITLNKNIYIVENYANDIAAHNGQLPAEMKKMFTFNTMTTGTFVIKANEARYKELVLRALDQYSDLLIKLIKEEIR